MRGSRHSDETRAAVTAALLTGQSVTEVATKYSLSKSVVSGIKLSISSDKLEQVRTKREYRIDELLCEYLVANLTTLRKQAEFTRNEEWLQKQSAAEVATLHGVMADKAVRLLEAASNANIELGGEHGDAEATDAPRETGGRSPHASDTQGGEERPNIDTP